MLHKSSLCRFSSKIWVWFLFNIIVCSQQLFFFLVLMLIYQGNVQYQSCVFWMPQILFVFEFECEQPNDLYMAELPFGCSEILHLSYWKWLNGNLARHLKKKLTFLSVNGWMEVWMTCVWSNCYSDIHTQTQMQTETGWSRMHTQSWISISIVCNTSNNCCSY